MILFTSGSTGSPEGVISTHGMLTANQQQMRQASPFLAEEPPVLLDWLPWSHTFGGNHDTNMVLTNGGTLWIDDGRPVPLLIGRTVAPVDLDDPGAGLLFRGRIAEDVKLASGTFVSVGTLRPRVLSAAAGLLSDAVLCGEGTDAVSALAWLYPDHAARCRDGIPDDDLRAELVAALDRLAREGGGSSQRVERLLLLTVSAALDAGEITDKGYVNQRAVRERRRDLVALVVSEQEDDRVVDR